MADHRRIGDEKQRLLISNTAAEMTGVTKNVRYRHAVHCYLADKDYGERMATALDLDFAKVKELSKLKQSELISATLDPKMM